MTTLATPHASMHGGPPGLKLVPTRGAAREPRSRACYRETTRDLRYVRIVGNDLRCGSIVCTVVLVGQGGYDTHGHTASDTLRAGADTR